MPARVLEDAKAHRRLLVRRPEVNRTGLGPQRLGCRLEHETHRRGHGLEPLELGPREHARVEVREQPGLLQHAHSHRAHIGQRVGVPLLLEPLRGLRPPILGTIAEREQGFLAPERGTFAGDRDDLVGG